MKLEDLKLQILPLVMRNLFNGVKMRKCWCFHGGLTMSMCGEIVHDVLLFSKHVELNVEGDK